MVPESLLIAIPSSRDIKADTVASLLFLKDFLYTKKIKHEFLLANNCPILVKFRNDAVKLAKQHGHSHLLFIDDDIRFDVKALNMLFDSESVVTAGNYFTKNWREVVPVATNEYHLRLPEPSLSGERYMKAIAPTGFMLIDIEKLTDSMSYPFFEIVIHGDSIISEDFTFCKKVLDRGLSCVVDNHASCYIQHIGDYPYGLTEDSFK